jgi:hypothetical protein
LEQLSRDLQGVQKAVQAGDPNGKDGQGDKNARALAEVRNLRQMLEQAQNARAQQQAQRQNYQSQNLSRGEGQEGQEQSGQEQPGQQPGNQQQGGQQQGGQQQGGGGQPGNQYSPYGGRDYAMDGQSVQSAIDELNSLRGRIDPRDRALLGYLNDTLGSLRLLHADPNVLQSTIGEDAVSRLERLEVELARRSGELQQLQGARLLAPEDSPEKYRDAVAEYFRKLSQTKR